MIGGNFGGTIRGGGGGLHLPRWPWSRFGAWEPSQLRPCCVPIRPLTSVNRRRFHTRARAQCLHAEAPRPRALQTDAERWRRRPLATCSSPVRRPGASSSQFGAGLEAGSGGQFSFHCSASNPIRSRSIQPYRRPDGLLSQPWPAYISGALEILLPRWPLMIAVGRPNK